MGHRGGGVLAFGLIGAGAAVLLLLIVYLQYPLGDLGRRAGRRGRSRPLPQPAADGRVSA